MSIRRLRQVLTHLTVVLVTLVAILLYQRHLQQKSLSSVAGEIIRISELPELPDDLTVRHAAIDPSEDERFVDVLLTLTGPTESLNSWLEKVDSWEKDRPGIIQNHKIREAEMSSRVDFNAEVYVKEE